MVLAIVVAGCSEPVSSPAGSSVAFDALWVRVDGRAVTDGEGVSFGFLPWAYGPYGGFYLNLGASVVGAEEVWLDAAIQNSAGDWLVDLPEPAWLAVDDRGWASNQVFLAPDRPTVEREAIACALDGDDIILRVEVGPVDDDSVSDTVSVAAVASLDLASLDCP